SGAMERMPAQLTRTSSRPWVATVSATSAAHASSLVTSSSAKEASSPSWSARVLPSPGRMSPSTTVAPSLIISSAVAAPRPRDPPLIRHTLSSSRPIEASLLTDQLFEPGVLQDLLVLLVQRLHERRQ